jgi:Fe-S cluster assembly iron-binding protein IscA
MLSITPQAATAVERWRRQLDAPKQSALRVYHDGRRWAFTFVRSPRNGDEVVEEMGVTAYVAPEVSEALDHATLDVTPDNDLVIKP